MTSGWKSQCPLQTLKQRAFLMSIIREYFSGQDVLEVETPILSSAGNTDVNIDSFTSQIINSDYAKSYLRTSPEFPLKRLLCNGIGDIFEIGKVFRKGETSITHNIEFTMLEWYRIGYDYNQLIQDVTQMFEFVLSAFKQSIPDTRILTYKESFKQYLSLDIDSISNTELNKTCMDYYYFGSELTIDEALDYLFATQIQPKLDKKCLTFLTHYPKSQAALSQINPDDRTTALRFEVFYQGYELGNGYQELTDAKEQILRFNQDNAKRVANNQEQMVVDENLILAMEKGLPDCSGVAIGIDRLLMVLLDKKTIGEVLSFNAKNS